MNCCANTNTFSDWTAKRMRMKKQPCSRWKRQAALTGSKDVTARHYPALNHLMLAGTGKDDPLNLLTTQTVDATLISDLASRVLAH